MGDSVAIASVHGGRNWSVLGAFRAGSLATMGAPSRQDWSAPTWEPQLRCATSSLSGGPSCSATWRSISAVGQVRGLKSRLRDICGSRVRLIGPGT